MKGSLVPAKRDTKAPVFDSDTDIEHREAPKVGVARRGKPKKGGRTAASGRNILGEADGSYDRAIPTRAYLASSEAGTEREGLETDVEVVAAGSQSEMEAPILQEGKNGNKKKGFINTDTLDAEALRVLAIQQYTIITDTAKVSNNVKGTCIRDIKNAARLLWDAVETLSYRLVDEETIRLRREAKNLRRQVEDLKEEVRSYREEANARRALPNGGEVEFSEQWQQTVRSAVEDMGLLLREHLGGMMNARFAGLEDRLLPKKVVRPPLAADARAAARKSAESPETESQASVTQKENDRAPAPLGMEWAALPSRADETVVREDMSWSVVTRRPKKKKDVVANPVAVVKSAPVANTKAKPKLPAVPRSAAVVITLQPGAVEQGIDYRTALLKVRETMGPTELGIDDLSLRHTATGSRLIEIPGAQASERADELAQKLQGALAGVAVVARPSKKADVKLVGLDETVSKEEILAIVQSKVACDASQMKVGEIHFNWRGEGVSYLSLPVAAAVTLVEMGKVLIGWSVVHVYPLEARPLRCYKCMELGHTRPLCPSETNRGLLCYRCGEPGHRVVDCRVETARCVLCAEAGRPSGHVMGGKYCKPPPVRGGRLRVALTVASERRNPVETVEMTS